MLSSVILHAPIARRFPPQPDAPADFANLTTYVLRVKASEVPLGIPEDANPRDPNLNRQVYRQVRASLVDPDTAGSFHLKHGGIVLIADSVVKTDEDHYRVSFTPDSQQGIANGSHSYHLILDEQANPDSDIPDNQYVEFKIHTAVPIGSVPDLADGLNTSMQVRQESLADLRGEFEWLKKALNAQPGGASHVSWHEGDSGEYDVREIIALLMALDPDRFPIDNTVGIENAYARVSNMFKSYLQPEQRKRVEKFGSIALDAMRLYEHIRISAVDVFDGKFRSTLLSERRANGQKHSFAYLLDAAGKPRTADVRLAKAPSIICFSAFRALVDVADDGTASWRYPFDEILQCWDANGEELLREFYDAFVGQHNRNLHYAGRSALAYRASVRTIQVADLTRRLTLQEKTK